ncbi:MAG TPA: penicillin-binding protein 2 [Bacillales bacterium]|nr:penicillin-binding protein 2 [Bacillales bacterium]
MERRIFYIGLLSFTIFLLLIARLAYIQLIATKSFSDEHVNLIRSSIHQRTERFVLANGRGHFLGRDGQPLRDRMHPALILFPFLKQTRWPAERIAEIIGSSPARLKQAVQQAKVPFTFSTELSKEQMKAIRDLHISGVYAEPIQSNQFDPFAEHVLGMVAENPKLVRERYPEKLKEGTVSLNAKIGISGLEEAFDPFLLSRGKAALEYFTEADGSPLFGLQVRYSGPASPYYPLNIRTTLDKKMQQIVQQAVDAAGLAKGGAVLLDAENSNLLAMVSRPEFNPHHPYAAGAKNYMILPQIPGSVFKIVTASAAIGKNAVDPDRLFNCDETLYGKPGAKRQLGKLTFKQSFAQSCNRTFGELGNELIEKDPDYMETYAKKLGLLGPVGWYGSVYHLESLSHFPNEEKGQVWENDAYKNNPKSVAQTAIGQLNVRVSPLAVANAMATISRGGKKLEVRAATEVDYQNEVQLAGFPIQPLDGESLTPYTAMKMQELLREVVTSPEGTGHRLADLPYSVSGKSGTAQTGDFTDNEWFAGYFPAGDPKYVLVVVDLQRRPGEMKTYQIYKQIVRSLYHLDH